MAQSLVHMGPMLVLAGLAAAWLGDVFASAGGYGFVTDMAIALAGSVVGGAIVGLAWSASVGMIAMFAIGCIGAVLAIAAQRALWRAAPVRG